MKNIKRQCRLRFLCRRKTNRRYNVENTKETLLLSVFCKGKKRSWICASFPSDFCVYIYLAIWLRHIRLALNMSFLCRYSTFQVIFFLSGKNPLATQNTNLILSFFLSVANVFFTFRETKNGPPIK